MKLAKYDPINMGEIADWGSETALMDQAAAEIERLSGENKKLEAALILAKEMFIANDLSLPRTLEVIDEPLSRA